MFKSFFEVVTIDVIVETQYEKVAFAFLDRIFNRFEAPTKGSINQNMNSMANFKSCVKIITFHDTNHDTTS
jgi:hypothetical protein